MSKHSNFGLVSQFNSVLGQGVAPMPLVPSLEQCRLRLALIKEEAQTELSAAFDSRDMIKIADAIGDSLVVVYGAANDCGLDADAIMTQIHISNMSKLCSSEEEAQKAVELYRQGAGLHGKNEPINAAYRESPIKGMYIVFNADTGKTLKGMSFVEPNLEAAVYPNGRTADPFEGMRQVAANAGIGGERMWQFQSALDQINAFIEIQKRQAANVANDETIAGEDVIEPQTEPVEPKRRTPRPKAVK